MQKYYCQYHKIINLNIYNVCYFLQNSPVKTDLRFCSKFDFYTSHSIQLQEKLNDINTNTKLAFFAISKFALPLHFLKFYQILLLLSGDIILNPGPVQADLCNDKIWEPFKTKGLHFCHLNVNSLLSKSSKIDKIRDIANKIKPAV